MIEQGAHAGSGDGELEEAGAPAEESAASAEVATGASSAESAAASAEVPTAASSAESAAAAGREVDAVDEWQAHWDNLHQRPFSEQINELREVEAKLRGELEAGM